MRNIEGAFVIIGGCFMLYTIYLPKKKGEEGTVIKWLTYYERLTSYKNNIIMSPGYLSKSKNSINKYLNSFKKQLYPKDSFNIGILNGMNGHYKTTDGNNYVLEYYKHVVDGMNDIEWIPLKNNGLVDHRKVMIFYTSIDGNYRPYISNSSQIIDFLNHVTVNAVLLGSSNQSFSTYFNNRSKKGEADVFMMAGCGNCIGELSISEMLSDVRNTIGKQYVDSSEIIYDKDETFFNQVASFLNDEHCTMSAGFAGYGNKNPEQFLKDVLENVLEDGVL